MRSPQPLQTYPPIQQQFSRIRKLNQTMIHAKNHPEVNQIRYSTSNTDVSQLETNRKTLYSHYLISPLSHKINYIHEPRSNSVQSCFASSPSQRQHLGSEINNRSSKNWGKPRRDPRQALTKNKGNNKVTSKFADCEFKIQTQQLDPSKNSLLLKIEKLQKSLLDSRQQNYWMTLRGESLEEKVEKQQKANFDLIEEMESLQSMYIRLKLQHDSEMTQYKQENESLRGVIKQASINASVESRTFNPLKISEIKSKPQSESFKDKNIEAMENSESYQTRISQLENQVTYYRQYYKNIQEQRLKKLNGFAANIEYQHNTALKLEKQLESTRQQLKITQQLLKQTLESSEISKRQINMQIDSLDATVIEQIDRLLKLYPNAMQENSMKVKKRILQILSISNKGKQSWSTGLKYVGDNDSQQGSQTAHPSMLMQQQQLDETLGQSGSLNKHEECSREQNAKHQHTILPIGTKSFVQNDYVSQFKKQKKITQENLKESQYCRREQQRKKLICHCLQMLGMQYFTKKDEFGQKLLTLVKNLLSIDKSNIDLETDLVKEIFKLCKKQNKGWEQQTHGVKVE